MTIVRSRKERAASAALKHLRYHQLICYEGILLIEEQARILRFMSEMTARIDTNEFSRKLELTPTELMQHMQQMAKEGLLKKVSGGFALTEKAKIALKVSSPVSGNMRFNFYTALDQPMCVSAGSVKEFYDLALKVNEASLEFHLCRGDFENWFSAAVGDSVFAAELAKIKKRNLKGEDLRKAIVKGLEARYSL